MEPSPIKGSNTALIGPAGTGKTFSTRTLYEIAGLRKIHLFTENSADRISDLPEAHWATVMPVPGSLPEMWEVAEQMNRLTFKELANLEGIHRERYQRFMDLLVVLNRFVDVRTGADLGAATDWGPDTVLIIDGLSNIGTMALQLIVGAKPNPDKGQWGSAMTMVFNLLLLLTTGLKCHLILIAHTEPELDPNTNLNINMLATLGQKLAPKIPKMFSDVILARKDGLTYDWSNADSSTTTKAGLLPPALSMPPTFVPLFAAWQAKGGLFSPTYKENLTTEAPANSGPQPEAKPQT